MSLKLHLLADATHALIGRIEAGQSRINDDFGRAQAIMPYLGLHLTEAGDTQVGFWTPELIDNAIPPENVYLEVLRPLGTIDFTHETQTLHFQRQRIALHPHGDYLFGVVAGMRAGSRDQVGDFYHIIYQDANRVWKRIPDYLAASIPFGVFAPSEYYDTVRMFDARTDKAHFSHLNFDPIQRKDGIDRIAPPTNILQLHIRYSSPEGTLAGLTRIYREIATKIRRGEPLTPAEKNFTGYDAIQLMPIEPIIEYEGQYNLWTVQADDGETVTVDLKKPDMTNWGYDVMVCASSAINPTLLGTGRPDELVDFIAELHNFPEKPVQIILDIVYGHIDNQALPLMNNHVFAGANMYGQNVNLQHPVTRALLLEMMRRKHNYGIDGIRVDGAQDFKNYDPVTQKMIHDDDYLHLMNDLILDVAGQRYRPWMIFEDGRPWPQDDWELASTYREVTKQMPNVWQWGPLTFAHNTPFLFTFWLMKWWRVREIAEVGREWITGCANHDTLRRGSQTPTDARVNTYLGGTLRDIFSKGYDNPAAKLFDYAMMPGVPMDFINAAMHAPWGFIRNTDDLYGVKVVSEEARFSEWLMSDEVYANPALFTRLKAFGFHTLRSVQVFMDVLDHAVQATRYNLRGIVHILNGDITPDFAVSDLDVPKLKAIARAWMDDVHEFCNISHYWDDVSAENADYMLAVRQFRQDRKWLMENLRADEYLNYLHPTSGAVIYYGLRRSPDDNETVLFIANMEGEVVTLNPTQLFIGHLPLDGWRAALVTPGIESPQIDAPLTLHDGQGVAFIRTNY